MEAVFFILIGGALFAQSWYMLGLYSDEGRTMAVIVGGLGLLSLVALSTSTFDSMLLTETGKKGIAVKPEEVLAATTLMKTLIALWSIYAIGVAAHGLWEFDGRAIGFYSVFLSIASLVVFIYYAAELQPIYGNATWLSLSGATLVLTVLAGMMFFALSFAFNVLRVVSGWFLLIGGGATVAVGLMIATRAIS